MDDLEMQRFVGSVEARTTILERRMEVIERDIKQELSGVRSGLTELQSAVDLSTGGRRAIGWVIGILGGLAALLTTLYHIGVFR